MGQSHWWRETSGLRIAAAFGILLAAIAAHFRAGWLIWGSDLAAADDPAHFTTGVMVFDYIRHGLSNPIDFAASFYVRFPKVALGHWPPVYYVLQSAAYALARPTIAVARLLSAGICFTVAVVLFRRIRKLHGIEIAALATACFLMLPIVQTSSWEVMSDLLVTLFLLLAALRFADFMESKAARDAAWFGFWAVLAILTKGSAWAFGLFALIAPLRSARGCFRTRWYWITGVVVLVLAAPFYLWVHALQAAYLADPGQLVASSVSLKWEKLQMLASFTRLMPPLFFAISGLGVICAARRKASGIEVAMVSLVISQCLFLILFPLTEATRYFLPSAAALLFLSARGLAAAGRGLGPLAVAVVCIAMCGFSRPARVDGYRSAVASIPYAAGGSVMLVASDSGGEGAFIAERLEGDTARGGVILRGTKTLARSRWSGDDYRLIYRTDSEVLSYLHSVPVRYVIIDQSALREPHRDLLEAAVRSAPEDFQLRGTFRITGGGRRGDLLIFENMRDRDRPAVIQMRVASRTVEHKLEQGLIRDGMRLQ